MVRSLTALRQEPEVLRCNFFFECYGHHRYLHGDEHSFPTRRSSDLDKFRVFHNGTGSYDVVAPKIRELLKKHRSRPIGARVTLTSGPLDIKRIYRHLTEEIGFWEVGFAPVTTSPGRGHAISEQGYDDMLGQFRDLADEFLEASVRNRHHGFSNVK